MRIYLSILSAVIILVSCSKTQPEQEFKDNLIITCDAETMKDGNLSDGKVVFSGSNKQCSDFSRSGKYSVKLDSSEKYGFVYHFTNVKKGNIIQASVWRKSDDKKGVIVVTADKQNQYIKSDKIIKTENGWDYLLVNFIAQSDYEKVKVLCFNPHPTSSYFDDLKIESFVKETKPPISNNSFKININEADFNIIKLYRAKALSQGVITDDLKKYVEASIDVEGKNIPVKLRLKGDWTDHLESNKWSFRIKVSGENSIYGMKTFSIQNPSTRSYMMEWFVHKICQSEDILTPRYKFIPVVLNGENMGVYALEEHFDKQLLEYNERREGPILKFDEAGVWEKNFLGKTEKKWIKSPGFEASEITVFKKKRTFKNPALKNQFTIAQGLMNDYKQFKPGSSSYIDAKKVAKYFAIMDLANVSHGMVWHNQRWYFNPVKNVLEPIAYDCFMDYGISDDRQIIYANPNIYKMYGEKAVNIMLFNNIELKHHYTNALRKYSDEAFLKNIFNQLNEEILAAEKLIQYEFPNYKLDKDFFIENAKKIREELPNFISRSNENYEFGLDEFEPYENDIVFETMALKAFTESKDSLTKTVKILNFHTHPIEIIGYGVKANPDSLINFKESYHLNEFKSLADQKTIKFNSKPKILFYKTSNSNKTFRTKVSKTSYPKNISYLGSTFDKLPYEYTGKTNEVLVKKGNYTFSNNVYIPKGLEVVIPAGTKMNFINNAGFISYSPVHLKGTEKEPIHIYSLDSSANGFTVIVENQKCSMEHVRFDNLSNMNKNLWTLTGAVTFYETDITINNCVFNGNLCEDGLNLIRSNFKMNNCTISNTYSDGFDADFCSGTVDNSFFTNTGNDCIDFSGSEVVISNCNIKGSGDKGISGGEKSFLTINNCNVNEANIGVAAKDFSNVIVNSIALNGCNYAYACYRKKPEYGGASMAVIKSDEENVKERFLIEIDSKVDYLGSTTRGLERLNIDSLYAPYK